MGAWPMRVLRVVFLREVYKKFYLYRKLALLGGFGFRSMR